MEQKSKRQRLRDLVHRQLSRIRNRGKPESEPEDPYAYVGAPRKPRPPQRGAARAEPLD